jgi:hypothetical protein
MNFNDVMKDMKQYLKIKIPKSDSVILKKKKFKNDFKLTDRNIGILPNYNYAMGLFGIVGSQKTTFAFNMIDIEDANYYGVFNDIFCYVPSADTMVGGMKNIKQANVNTNVNMKTLLDQLRRIYINHKIFEMFRNIDWVAKECKKAYKEGNTNRYLFLASLYKKMKEEGYIPRYRVLFLFDDCMSDIEDLCRVPAFFTIFKKLVKNRRHIGDGICLIFSTQRYVDLPKALRSNLSNIMMMSNADNAEFKAIREEKITIPPDAMREMMDEIFADDFNENEEQTEEIPTDKWNFLNISIPNYKLGKKPKYEYYNGLHTRYIIGGTLRKIKEMYGIKNKQKFMTDKDIKEHTKDKEEMFDDDVYDKIADEELKEKKTHEETF